MLSARDRFLQLEQQYSQSTRMRPCRPDSLHSARSSNFVLQNKSHNSLEQEMPRGETNNKMPVTEFWVDRAMKFFEVLTKYSTLNIHNYIICDNIRPGGGLRTTTSPPLVPPLSSDCWVVLSWESWVRNRFVFSMSGGSFISNNNPKVWETIRA